MLVLLTAPLRVAATHPTDGAWTFSLDALLAIVAAAIALAGFLAALGVYLAQRVDSKRRDAKAARALLIAAQQGMTWADYYFTTDYTGEAGQARANAHYEAVMQAGWPRIFPVPTEPLAAVLISPAAGSGIAQTTLAAVGTALWKVGLFNDLVRQQSDFITLHLAEIKDGRLPPVRRQALALAASHLSLLLHRDGIGNPTWYADLKRELKDNISHLDQTAKTRRPF